MTLAGQVEEKVIEDEGRNGRKRRRPRRTSINPGESRRAWTLIAPAILLLILIVGYPVLKALYQSFLTDPGLDKSTGLFNQGNAWNGITNYTHWLGQRCAVAGGGTQSCPSGTLGSQFWGSAGVTLGITIVACTIETVIGMGFALIMNRAFRGRALVRVAILIPWAIPTAVTAKLFFFIFAFDGIANSLFHTHILWTGDAWPARFAIIIADVWKTTPFMALLILAGLQVIPTEVYEAGSIDGASRWQQFRLITLPLVKTALMVAVLFRTLDVLRIFDLPWILTQGGGGNGHATTSLSILVINQLRSGTHSAAALSTITFIIIFFVAFIFVRFLGANVASNPSPKRKKRKKDDELVDAEAI
jgi:multiple sugar transport system permease protein